MAIITNRKLEKDFYKDMQKVYEILKKYGCVDLDVKTIKYGIIPAKEIPAQYTFVLDVNFNKR